MSLNIEYESRSLISKKQYEKLIEYSMSLSLPSKKIEQTNYYIDTPNLFLNSIHWMLRIRVMSDGISELTLKIAGDNGDKEYNEPIEKDATYQNRLNLPNGEILDLLKSVLKDNIKDLSIISKLMTLRKEIYFNDYTLVLDENHYFDVIDFNIEIESNEIKKSHDLMRFYCDRFNINRINPISKSRRLFNYYKAKEK